jgi:hypothetical protein
MTLLDYILWSLQVGAAIAVIAANVYMLGLRLGWWKRPRRPPS